MKYLLMSVLTILGAGVGDAQGKTATTLSYLCERGARIEATYLNFAEDSFAILFAEGRQVAFKAETSGSGARYVSVDDAVPYVWWTKNSQGDLYVKVGGTDIPVISKCVEAS